MMNNVVHHVGNRRLPVQGRFTWLWSEECDRPAHSRWWRLDAQALRNHSSNSQPRNPKFWFWDFGSATCDRLASSNQPGEHHTPATHFYPSFLLRISRDFPAHCCACLMLRDQHLRKRHWALGSNTSFTETIRVPSFADSPLNAARVQLTIPCALLSQPYHTYSF